MNNFKNLTYKTQLDDRIYFAGPKNTIYRVMKKYNSTPQKISERVFICEVFHEPLCRCHRDKKI